MIHLLRIHYKKGQKKTYLIMILRFFSDFLYKGICCGYSFELHRQVNAIQMSTHNICLYKKNRQKVHLLDCVLIGICAEIRSNMVSYFTHVSQKCLKCKTNQVGNKRNELYFCGFYLCVNACKSLTNII